MNSRFAHCLFKTENGYEKNTSRDVLHVLNMLIVFFLFFDFMFVSDISSMLLMIEFAVNLALAMVYRIYRKDGRFRKAVIVLRSVAIIILVLAVLSTKMQQK